MRLNAIIIFQKYAHTGVWPRTVYFLLESRPYGVWDRMGTTTSLNSIILTFPAQ